MSPGCHPAVSVPAVSGRSRGTVIDLRAARRDRLAVEIVDQLRAGYGSVVRDAGEIHDVDFWRAAARRAGRLMGVPIRTGLAPDRSRVWAVDNS